ncbi:hypothetical protein [Actinomadura madurae]|uniref:hypothetical protein n=1 Tax=Actinomadura madurae TaxID=1993 RepID=UPI0020D23FC3|nr:hypothetical protein [Actinomadura madurae]
MRICVVALGKIGLPLAVQFARKGHRVIGADVDERVVADVNAAASRSPARRTSASTSARRSGPGC